MRLRATCMYVVLAGVLASAPSAWAITPATQQNLTDGDRYYEQGKLEKFAASYDLAIKAEPNEVPGSAYAKYASIFFIQKKYEVGLKWIESVAEKYHAGDPDILEQKALILSKLPGRRDDAIKLAEEVTKKKPSAYFAQTLVGDYYYSAGAGSAEKTAAAYEAYLKYRPEALSEADGLILVKLGNTYLYQNETEKAEDAFGRAVKNKDGRAVANGRKGLCATYVAESLWDRAITLCEQVIKDKKALKGDASPYYNVGQAYLARNKLDDALSAANSFIGFEPKKAKGYLLRGKIFSKQNKFNDAEGQYNKASELEPNNPAVAIELGKVYLDQNQPKKAILKLEKVNNPDVEVLTYLSRAYKNDNQAGKAAATADKALTLKPDDYSLLTLAGDAYYNDQNLGEAKGRFSKALTIKPKDAKARGGLIDTINRQAFGEFEKGNSAAAEKLLLDAYAVDAGSTITNYNLGLIALDNKKYAEAIKYLGVRLVKTPDELLTNRLLAKAYLNSNNDAKAIEHYKKAAEEAQRQRANVVLAEIYTEWAPLMLKSGKVDDAADKLEIAAQYALGQPFEGAAKRNLQIALFRRGYERWKAGKRQEAVADLEGATREPKLLVGVEEDTFMFALGVAYLSVGQEAKASPIFGKYAGKTNLTFLKAPFDKIGGDFFMALVWYREGNTAARVKAAVVFDRLAPKATGGFKAKLQDLVRSAYEGAAYEEYAKGGGGAKGFLDKAKKAGGSRTVDHNLAVVNFKDRNAQATFKAFGDNPPEALVNFGILVDQGGTDPKLAYDSYVAAKAKGARAPKLDEWIDAKKRIFNY